MARVRFRNHVATVTVEVPVADYDAATFAEFPRDGGGCSIGTLVPDSWFMREAAARLLAKADELQRQRRCPQCGETFAAATARAVYCSTRCRVAAARARAS